MNKKMLVIGASAGALYLLLQLSKPANDTGESDNENTLLEDATNMISSTDSSTGSDANLIAFLQTIRVSEGTAGPQGYNTQYGYTYFSDFSTHPALAGWGGERLPDAMCAAAGFSPGCVSTAAGAYQINKPTFRRMAAKLGISDFSPESQDAIAVGLIDEKGALADARNGNFAVAVGKVRKIWASLPGAGYGQGEHSIDKLQTAYLNAGGTLA